MKPVEYKYISNTGQIPASMYSSTDYQQYLADWTNKLYEANYNADPKYQSYLPKGQEYQNLSPKGQADFAGRSESFSVPKDLNVLPNGKPLPTQTQQTNTNKGSSVADTLIQSGVPMVGEIINAYKFDDTQDDLLARTSFSQGDVGGIKYNRRSYVNQDYLDEVNKESWNRVLRSGIAGWNLGGSAYNSYQNAKAASSIASSASNGAAASGAASGSGGGGSAGAGFAAKLFAGAGATLASIFGVGSRADKAEALREKTNRGILRYNNFNQYGALGELAGINLAKKYGNQENQLLSTSIGTAPLNPKLNKQTTKDYVVDTSDGMAFGPQNAWVEKDEKIVNMKTGATHTVKRGPNDTARAYLDPEDAVFPKRKKNPETGNSFADDVEQYRNRGDLWHLVDLMSQQNNKNKNKNMIKAGYGYEPWIAHLPGMLGGLGDYLSARSQSVKMPHTYAANPYAGMALKDLYGLRLSEYPMMNKVYKQYANAMRGIDMSGGLSGGQRTLSRLSALRGTQSAIADALFNIGAQNNEYKKYAATAALQAGNEAAKNMMAANQWDINMYDKRKGAQRSLMNAGWNKFTNSWEQTYADLNKRRNFDFTLGLYHNDQKLKKDELNLLAQQLDVYKKQNGILV